MDGLPVSTEKIERSIQESPSEVYAHMQKLIAVDPRSHYKEIQNRRRKFQLRKEKELADLVSVPYAQGAIAPVADNL